MQYFLLIFATALAPIFWGSTYYVTTEFMPNGYPVTIAMWRALLGGLLLLALVRQLPPRDWLLKILTLGALNFTIFWALLFVSAYRLPGGVAATVGAIQPLFVLFLAKTFLGHPINTKAILIALCGILGVAILLLNAQAKLDMIGVIAGVGGALSMAFGVVLTRKWKPQVSLMTFTAWQLSAGGLLLVPLALMMEPSLPALSSENVAGLLYLGLIGGAMTYLLWFNGLDKLAPASVSLLGFLSPVTAVLLGWVILNQHLTSVQLAGAALTLASVWFGQIKPPQKNALAAEESPSQPHTAFQPQCPPLAEENCK